MSCPWCRGVASTAAAGRSCAQHPPAATISSLAIAALVSSICCGLVGLVFSIGAIVECTRSRGRLRGRRLAAVSIVIALVNLAVVIALATRPHSR